MNVILIKVGRYCGKVGHSGAVYIQYNTKVWESRVLLEDGELWEGPAVLEGGRVVGRCGNAIVSMRGATNSLNANDGVIGVVLISSAARSVVNSADAMPILRVTAILYYRMSQLDCAVVLGNNIAACRAA